MFTEIRAANFKSWENLTLPLAKVTGLFGANSSGKTSILQVLLLLKQSMESSNRQSPLDLGDSRTPVRMNSFADIVRNHEERSRLGLGFSWDDFSFDTEIDDFLGTMLVRNLHYVWEDGWLDYKRIDSVGRYELSGELNGGRDHFTPRGGNTTQLPAPRGFYGLPVEVNRDYQNSSFIPGLEYQLEKQLQAIRYLGPLRQRPEAFYSWTGSSQEDVGFDGAETVAALLAAQVSEERRESGSVSVGERVASWLKQLGLVHSFHVAPVAEGANIYRVHVRRSDSSPEVLLTDVGFGVSQVLPVLVLLAYVPEGSTVILEQPEIHLHPAVQSGLADVILEAALVRNVQVIVESHSEHLLKRIQLRVAEQQLNNETRVSADDIRLWFIDQEGPVSRASDLQLNEYGEIMNWPKGFFGDRLAETGRLAQAAMQRRRNESQS